MSLAAGTRLGAYEITGTLGAGGMGEVYRARDTRLKREVALKVLPDSFAADPERLARFQREAEVLASLNHPNIAAIYGLEHADGVRALVLELVEGPTLAERMERTALGSGLSAFGRNAGGERSGRGPAPKAQSRKPGRGLPVAEALAIARQIADALEAAHEQGIVHRDLKPANIKVRDDGTVKVLDFGLAKAMELAGRVPVTALPGPAGPEGADYVPSSQAPTITTPAHLRQGSGGQAMTHAGVILGTPAYMAPEQAKGRPVDKRADIWAFGCVLYEMLTGKPAFPPEDTVSGSIVAILSSEPDWAELPAALPSGARVLLKRCLQKDLRHRLPHIGVARLDLEQAAAEDSPQAGSTDRVPSHRAGRERVWWIAALIATILLSSIAGWSLRKATPGPEMRLEVTTPNSSSPESFELSPDGQQLVFVANGEGRSQLWLRNLATSAAQPLPGTDGALRPFWAPDGRSIGFFADGGLKRLDLGGESPRMLASPAAPTGGAWSADGVILFRRTILGGPLFRVSSDGSEPAPVTTLRGQRAHGSPRFLPDGHHFLYRATGTDETQGIYLASLDVPEAVRIVPETTPFTYSQGSLLWVSRGAVVSQRLDVDKRTLIGARVTLSDSAFAISASLNGTVAYRANPTKRQLRWFDRTGTDLGPLGPVEDEGTLRSGAGPRLSPDGNRAAVRRVSQPVDGDEDLWLLAGPRVMRLTAEKGYERNPVWSPDGSRIAFTSNRTGVQNLYVMSSAGGGGDTLLHDSPDDKTPSDWSSDGRFLLFHSRDPKTDQDLWVLLLTGQPRAFPILKTNFIERHAQFSPDGRWIAYMSNESGQSEIYVRPFVVSSSWEDARPGDAVREGATSARWQVSAGGGIFPRWSRDGRELYYIAPEAQMMVVPIQATAATFAAGEPQVLFQTRIMQGGEDIGQGPMFDVSRDGRFLLTTQLDESVPPIMLLLNGRWRTE